MSSVSEGGGKEIGLVTGRAGGRRTGQWDQAENGPRAQPWLLGLGEKQETKPTLKPSDPCEMRREAGGPGLWRGVDEVGAV